MAGTVSQSESQRYYKRMANLAVQMQGIYEEALRLDSEKTTFNLAVNLDPDNSAAGLLVADVVAFFTGPLDDFVSFFENGSVPVDAQRRNKINTLSAAEPFL